MDANRIIQGDCIAGMKTLPDGCVHCCVTSPPYYALRDYGVEGQIGLEDTPEAYVAKMVEVFREVKRILRDDGTCWVNLGDSYARGNGSKNGQSTAGDKQQTNRGAMQHSKSGKIVDGYKDKDLMGIPWRVAFALQTDGWYLRQDLIWHKPAPMPESVTDRCTKAHEYLFLLSKSQMYYYDAQAIAEAADTAGERRITVDHGGGGYQAAAMGRKPSGNQIPGTVVVRSGTRNKRSVWTVATQSYSEAHFATYPPKLIEPCILAGTSERGCCSNCGAPWERVTQREQLKRERPNDYTKRTGQDGTGNSCANSVAGVSVVTTGWQPTCDCNAEIKPCIVLDPFGGSGTTAQVARSLGRDWLLCELNPDYIALAEKRIRTPLYKDDVPKQVDSMPGQKELFA